MKKIYTFIMLLSAGSIAFTSCGAGKNSSKGILGDNGSVVGTVAKTVATVVGVILLTKLLKSVLGTIGGSTTFAALSQNQDFTSGFNENTKLSSFAGNDLTKAALQVLVAEHYKIPLGTVANNYSSLVTAGDLATFVGKNADATVLSGIK